MFNTFPFSSIVVAKLSNFITPERKEERDGDI